MRFRSRSGVFGFCHRRGKSVANAKILACSSSVNTLRSTCRWRSYSRWASSTVRSLLFHSDSNASATRRFAGSNVMHNILQSIFSSAARRCTPGESVKPIAATVS